MRRPFTLAFTLVAALSVGWSTTPVSAAALARPAAERTTARTEAQATPAVATTPTTLQAFRGGSEQMALATPGTTSSTTKTPADPSIAAGASAVVEAVNSAIFVYPRSGAPPVVLSINTIMNTSPGWAVKYPHVVYDPFSGRFILAVVQYNAAGSTCGSDQSQIQVAVSGADPTMAWHTSRTFNNEATLPDVGAGDLPEAANLSLGMTSGVVALSWDYFGCLHGTLFGSQTDVIQRADLAAGTLQVGSARFFTGGPLGVQNAMDLSSATLEYQIVNDVSCTVPAANTYAVFRITGTPDAKNVVIACAASESEPNGSSVPPAAAQNGVSAALQTNDDRFLSAMWANNVLWASGNTGCTPSGDTHVRSCLNVVSVAASTTGVVTGGTQLTPEGVNGASLFYPSIAADSAGDIFTTFDESSSSAFESMMVATISGGTWSSFITAHTSTATYSPAGCSTCTWGDYSSAVQDPVHPTDVWVVSETDDADTGGTNCANANTCWDTYVARYTFALPSIASLTPSTGPGGGGQVVTVAGSDFALGTIATLGGTALTISNLTPDSFTFTTPPGPAAGGVVHAVATDSLGSSSPTSAGSSYLYVPLSNFVPRTPFRIFDTRNKGQVPLGPNASRLVQITGVGTAPIPSTAVAVVLNVTEVGGSAASLLTVYPAGTRVPNASNLNFRAGTVTPNLVTVTLGAGGAVDIYNALGTVNVFADVEGYFAPPLAATPAGEFHPISPLRVCDTRSSTMIASPCHTHGVLVGGAPMVVNVTGPGPGAIPGDGTAVAAVLNLTAVSGTAPTYLSVYPTSSTGTCAVPSVSTLNLLALAVEANRVMVSLGPQTAGGHPTSVCVYAAKGKINVLLDANGWYGSATAPAGFQYQPIAPSRICDTRVVSAGCSIGPIGAGLGGQRLIRVAGVGGVPALGGPTVIQAVIANLTAIAPTRGTYMVGYSASLTGPGGASDINLVATATLPNLIVVQVDTTAGPDDGDIELLNAVGSVNAVIDVEGWFQ